MRAIDADHLRRWILSRVFKTQLSAADVIDQIDREDTIEPQRTGMWLEWMEVSYYGAPPTYVYSCSGCGLKSFGMHNFCPNCGAKMEGR